MSTNLAEPTTVGESVYRQIRSDIIFGRLPPGQKLRLDRLKEASRHRCKHAARDPQQAVLRRARRRGGAEGIHVSPVSVADLRELAALRLLVECPAMEESFQAGDIDWEGRVAAAHHKLASVEAMMMRGDEGSAEDWKKYDWEFHQALISACGSNALIGTCASIYDRYLRYLMIALSFRGEITAGEHRLLFDCALVGTSQRPGRCSRGISWGASNAPSHPIHLVSDAARSRRGVRFSRFHRTSHPVTDTGGGFSGRLAWHRSGINRQPPLG